MLVKYSLISPPHTNAWEVTSLPQRLSCHPLSNHIVWLHGERWEKERNLLYLRGGAAVLLHDSKNTFFPP